MPLPRSYWRRASPTFPEHHEFIEVLPNTGRILSSAVIKDSTVKSVPIAVIYEDAGEGQVRVKMRPSNPWRINWFREERDQIYWSQDGISFKHPWDRIQECEMPDWWPDFRDRAWTRMEQREQEAGRCFPPEANKD